MPQGLFLAAVGGFGAEPAPPRLRVAGVGLLALGVPCFVVGLRESTICQGGEVQVTWSTEWSCTPGLSAVSPTAPVGHWSARYYAEPVPYSKPEQTRFATGSLSLPFLLAAQQQPQGQPLGALHSVQPLGALACVHYHHRVSPSGVCSSLPWRVMVVIAEAL